MESPTTPIDGEVDNRKRVCKACDRCRIKKSKCDGKKPCSRCRNDDAICVFGGRKRKTDRVHPKGYVEILERQQKQLVKGIRAIYDRHLSGKTWHGPFPQNGYPPTHEILEYLGALDVEDSSDEEDQDSSCHFQESVQQLRNSITNRLEVKTSKAAPPINLGKHEHHNLATSQGAGNCFERMHRADSSDFSTSLRQSPESLTTSKTSPSTSVDSQHWSTSLWLEQRQNMWPEKSTATATDFLHGCETEILDSPMQDAFEDPFLAAPWDPDEDFGRFAYH